MARFPPIFPYRSMAKARALRRREARRGTKYRFTLFCEGLNTEPAYFEAIRRAFGSSVVKIKVVRGAGDPRSIAEKAIRSLSHPRSRKEQYKRYGQIWAVFDRDNHAGFEEAVERCNANGIGVARSNPCFELWLILHNREYDRPCDSRQAQRTLEKVYPKYNRHRAKTLSCDALVKQIEIAEQRAEAQLARRDQQNRPFGNPSTTVGRLTSEIRKADERSGR